MNRNAQYETRMKEKGLKKITLWVPEDREYDIKQAVALMCSNEDLTINVLKSLESGRLVSMHSN